MARRDGGGVKAGGAPRVEHRPSHIVGLGGSAGGLEALVQFFSNAPPDTGRAFVIVTHLDPDHKALLPELLQRTTVMPVRQVTDGVRVIANAVYVIPPNHTLELDDDVLRLGPASRTGPRTPIDAFFRSLARGRGPTAVGVVLSGTGSDGAQGLRAIAEAGGATLVQEPSNASFDAMPLAALAAVPKASVAPAAELPCSIVEPGTSVTTDPALGRVLELLRLRTGHDLTQYKVTSIERRLERRLGVLHLATLDAYAGYLEATPEEADLLLRELLIGVTQFFRDPEAFAILGALVLPTVLATKHAPRTLRAWVAGCSSGEEAYSLAIVLHEVLEAARAIDVQVQVYATDIDASAIAQARSGSYPAEIAKDVGPERLARYFTRDDLGYRIRKEIRDTIVFAEHDLLADPPFTRIDVLCCRNVMIYMQPALQQRLLPQFHYALATGGVLVLGSAETVSPSLGLFAPIDAKAKVFRRIAVRGRGRRVELPLTARTPAAVRSRIATGELTVVEAARRAIVENIAPPTVVINDRGDVLYSSRRTGRYLEPPVGKTNINIFAMAREGLGSHLGQAVRQAVAKHRRVDLPAWRSVASAVGAPSISRSCR